MEVGPEYYCEQGQLANEVNASMKEKQQVK